MNKPTTQRQARQANNTSTRDSARSSRATRTVVQEEVQVMDDLLRKILANAHKNKASDIHLTVGRPPTFRIHGALKVIKAPTLTKSDTSRMIRSILTAEEWNELERTREIDFSCSIKGVSRFRVNAFYQRGALSAAFRTISDTVPSIDELGLPPIAQSITNAHHGLVLVTGPTGSGKSSTLAAMIRHINQTSSKHIITLEDPIEYVHESERSLIDQREVGIDTMSFLNGLRASLRQDPDVILVGELRDLETISTAITAAETGHLVLGTLHTNTATSTIERIIDVFPPEQQPQVRMQLGLTLRAVIAQQLIPTIDGRGRVVATEVMINTPAVQNLISGGKISQIQNVLQTSKAEQMHTMDMSLRNLISQDIVSYESVQALLVQDN